VRTWARLFPLVLSACAHAAPDPGQAISPLETGTDFHMHVRSRPSDYFPVDGAHALAAADAAGLRRAWILSKAHHATDEAEARLENDFVIREAKKAPGRLVPVISLAPRAWAEGELTRAKAAGGRALKLHSMVAGLDLTQPEDLAAFEALFAAAEREKLPILVHGAVTHAGEAEALIALAERHCGTRIIIAHLLGRDARLLPTIKGSHIFVDISGINYLETDVQRAAIAALVRQAGIRRFVFGSDWPYIHPAETLRALERLPLTPEERALILSGNARAFDDLFSGPGS
jgi:predicted TIM-barrel fold metal-dependent hydrolase